MSIIARDHRCYVLRALSCTDSIPDCQGTPGTDSTKLFLHPVTLPVATRDCRIQRAGYADLCIPTPAQTWCNKKAWYHHGVAPAVFVNNGTNQLWPHCAGGNDHQQQMQNCARSWHNGRHNQQRAASCVIQGTACQHRAVSCTSRRSSSFTVLTYPEYTRVWNHLSNPGQQWSIPDQGDSDDTT